MKKIFTLIMFFVSVSLISAKEIEVKFYDCIDGDTAKFIYEEEKITARFLAIDTPETVHPNKGEESFGKEAADYTCNKLKNAKKIVLEYDKESDNLDKYNRHLVWVFVDDELLQEKLVRKGFASVAYLYGDYKYTEILEETEQIAEDNKLGIWNTKEEIKKEIKVEEDVKKEVETNETKDNNNGTKINNFIKEYKEYIILIGALIMISIFNLKSKKKIKNKLKRKIKNDIKIILKKVRIF